MIYLFWIGDKKPKICDQLDKIGMKYELGPSSKDHKYLYENFEYYKKSYNQKIWAFCADVWRFFKLSEKKGIYFDVTAEIGADFAKKIHELEESKSQTVALRVTGYHASIDILVSTVEGNKIYKDVLDIYKKLNGNPRLHFIGPTIFSYVLWKHRPSWFENNWDEQADDQISILSYEWHVMKNFYVKKGLGSWKAIKHKTANLDRQYELYLKHTHPRIHSIKVIAKQSRQNIFEYNPYSIRDICDSTNSKETLKEVKKIYKKIEFKKDISQWLIWSMLFRFFTLKKAK